MKLLSVVSVLALSLVPLSAAPVGAFAAVANPYAAAGGQDPAGFGPLDPSAPTGLTPEQIIQKFGARESEFNRARDNYIFRQTVKVNTISDDTGKPDGEYLQVTDILFDKQGRRDERVVFAPTNTLERVQMSPTDFDEIEHRIPFVLTTEDLPQYDIKYLGRQKVDDLETYVFDAGPKTLEKGKHYFQGKVWVDQQDFQIVLINGKTVPQDTRKGHEDLQPPFTTYYEQVDGKYWFPTYSKAEGILHFQGGDGYMSQDVHMRNIIKYTDYKQFRATSRIIYNGQDITNTREDNKGNNQPKPADTSH
ncbi:outer membrane lipoprotein-sorting protein [Edaphobacter bradus]|uniref:outer membrane lipoprotein-sorting protein n=1 Tax=Edaphobacter bradus TaxID=2259016 RepID=UPI0021E00226|nr:outer membrane lipoprotein-sorting protein [Edaphobacter bradus]